MNQSTELNFNINWLTYIQNLHECLRVAEKPFIADLWYVHNWTLEFFSYDYICCVQFKVDSETFSWQFSIYSQSFYQNFAESRRKKIFYFHISYFVLMSDLGFEPRLFVYYTANSTMATVYCCNIFHRFLISWKERSPMNFLNIV